MIDIQHISKIYGRSENRFVALDDITIHIDDAETIAVVGKSGSGKSTLMHIMSGLDHPTAGQVLVDGTDLFAMKPKAMDSFRSKTISFIFQSFFIEANQTCYQNVALPLEIAKVPLSQRRALVMSALEAVELDSKTNNKAGDLSGGQKQRLAIARAVVNKPRILFADEPTGNLDSQTGKKIIDLLFSLNQRLGCTIVLVTHDKELARRCQRQITLKDGKLVD